MCVYTYIKSFSLIINACKYIYLYTYAYIDKYIYIYTYIHIHIYVYVYIYVYIYTYIYFSWPPIFDRDLRDRLVFFIQAGS